MPLDNKETTPINIEKKKRGPLYSPFSKEFYMHYRGMSEKKATKEAKSKRPCNKEYWLKKGLTNAESIQKVKEHQIKTSLILQEKVKSGEIVVNCSTRVEYWLSQGFSEEEAKIKLIERQTTFSKKKLIEKLGEEEGIKRWKERQIKWQRTLGDKPQEEIDEMNRKKAITLTSMQEKYGEDLGEEKYNNWRKQVKEAGIINFPKSKYNFSKESTDFFKKITEYIIPAFNLSSQKILFGDDDNKELIIFGESNSFFFYDYCISELMIIIEYHGIMYHPNKAKLNDFEWKTWKQLRTNESADSVYARDQLKKELAIKNGYTFLEVFSDDPEKLYKVIEFIRKKYEDNNRNNK